MIAAKKVPFVDARDLDALNVAVEGLEQALHEVVRERARQLGTLEREQDRRRLGLADPDREQPSGTGLLVERLQ